ncbi:hypothetical protein LC085_16900 [Bacillus tianshenii]|uniref:zinc ribbon domain-containing protein n=1 Tax=Sutcliffiella tianshenii TaxID=1463404 RepID=UPI001CD7BB6F|nr:hypothetical protein [Bacillus tianshenii]MCA1321586.1 hypothetical protein [Bacillus tianshenii]
MRFCTECGTKADDQSQMCTECGTKLPSPKRSSGEQGKPGLPAFSKKTKIIAASVLAVFIALFAAYKVIGSYNSPEKVMERFLEAVQKEDVGYLTETLVPADDKLKMKEENAKALLAYWKEDKEAKKAFFTYLQETSKEMDRPSSRTKAAFNELLQDDEHQIIQFKKDGKKLLFFDSYKFVVQPLMVEVYTNYPDVAFYLNGKKQQAKLDEEQGSYLLGPVLPGVHTIKGTLETDFLTLDKEVEAHVFGTNHYEDIYFDAEEIFVESNIMDGTIIVNGKETDLVLDEGSLRFGPVLVDGSMTLQVQKESPLGMLKSPEYKIEEEYIFADVSISDESKEEALTFINDALLSYRKALVGKDPAHLTSYSGHELSYIEEYIKDMGNDDQWIGYLLSTTYNMDTFSTWEENGDWHVAVTLNSKWLMNDYYGELSEFDYYDRYYLKWTGDSWSIYETDSSWGSVDDAESTREFEFDQKEQEKDSPKPKVVLDEQSLISDYLYGLADAVNYGDFSEVEPYLLPDSELYKSQKDLVSRLYGEGTKEYVSDFEILNTEKLDDENGTVLLTVSETFEIQKQDEEAVQKTFKWKYTAQVHQGKYYLSKIE